MNVSQIVKTTTFLIMFAVSSAVRAEGTGSDHNAVDEVTLRAIEMYQQANSLYLNQKFAEAYVFYKAAWDLRPNYKVAGDLGICEYDLRKYRDAAEHLSLALRENREGGIEATRSYFFERLTDAERYVGLIEVHVDNAATAELFIENKYIGRIPSDTPVYVEPGRFVITARNDIASGSVRLEIKKGEKRKVNLRILPTPLPAPLHLESTSFSTGTYAAGAGAAVALTAGGIYMAETERSTSMGPPQYSYLWGPLIASGAVALVSLTVLFGSVVSKEKPPRISAMVLPVRNHWQIGFRGTF